MSVMSTDEKREAVQSWMQLIEGRVTTLENILLELLFKLKEAGMIVEEDESITEE